MIQHCTVECVRGELRSPREEWERGCWSAVRTLGLMLHSSHRGGVGRSGPGFRQLKLWRYNKSSGTRFPLLLCRDSITTAHFCIEMDKYNERPTNPELLSVIVLADPSCWERSIDPERRKVTAGSAVKGYVRDVNKTYFILGREIPIITYETQQTTESAAKQPAHKGLLWQWDEWEESLLTETTDRFS